jgi:prevent-host-death family protein
MKTASIAKLGQRPGDCVAASEKEPVVITRNGRPVAVLIAVHDEDDVDRLIMACSPRLQARLEAAQRRIQAGLGIPEEEFWKRIESRNKARKSRSLAHLPRRTASR